jgi:hypothetical protein
MFQYFPRKAACANTGGESMSDIVEHGAVPTIYADGFDDHQIINGSLRCTGYTIAPGDFPGCEPLKMAVVKLIISPAGADASQMETQRVLREKPAPALQIMLSKMRGH